MPERMPRDALDVVLKGGIWPKGPFPVDERRCKDPIRVLVVWRMVTPNQQGRSQGRKHFHTLARCLRLHLGLRLGDVASLKIKPACIQVEVRPLEATHLASAQRRCRRNS